MAESAKPKRKRTAAQIAANRHLNPAKKGEVRNPTGRNGWTVLQEKLGILAAKNGVSVYQAMLDIATDPDAPDAVAAAKLVLGPALAVKVEVSGEGGGPVQFSWKKPDGGA